MFGVAGCHHTPLSLAHLSPGHDVQATKGDAWVKSK
jgi:hypothetical protein